MPIGGAYRLIDVPMSNCINSGISKIYILTQFNSTSLNRHLARTYNMGSGVRFGGEGFVEVLAATQVGRGEWRPGGGGGRCMVQTSNSLGAGARKGGVLGWQCGGRCWGCLFAQGVVRCTGGCKEAGGAGATEHCSGGVQGGRWEWRAEGWQAG